VQASHPRRQARDHPDPLLVRRTCLRVAEYHDAMGKLVRGADGLPADEVGEWVEEKLFDITQYVKLSHGARRSTPMAIDEDARRVGIHESSGLTRQRR
jgi:hypothetical protein